MAAQVSGWDHDGVQPEHALALKLDPADRRLRLTLELASQLVGFPRQLGTHPGGFVLTRDRLDELVPLEPAAMADRQVIVRYTRSQDILCQGRGSAANSAVCYVLGVTSIDPVRSGLLF